MIPYDENTLKDYNFSMYFRLCDYTKLRINEIFYIFFMKFQDHLRFYYKYPNFL